MTKNKVNITLYILIAISALIAFISYPFLPNEIPMQWNGTEVNWYANKFMIFLFPIITISVLFLFKPTIGIRLRTRLSFESPLISNIIKISISIVFLTCEIYTIAYCFGFRWRIDYILLVELIIMIIIGFIIASHYKYR